MKIKYTKIPLVSVFLIFSSGISLVLNLSCKKYAAATPAFFINANAVSVNTPTLTQGSNSHKITELWMYVNGFFQGAYPVGSVMPVPNNNQNAKVEFYAGIKNNGIKATRIYYPFYERIILDTLIETGKTLNRNFNFKYKAETKFTWVEGFDTGQGYSIINSPISSATFVTVYSPESFESNSIKLAVTQNQTIGQLESAIAYTLPLSSANVYLELDYKCFVDFEVGVISGTTQKPARGVRASTSWNKIYISLADAVSSPPTSTAQKIYFKIKKLTDTDDARLYLDNIKLLNF